MDALTSLMQTLDLNSKIISEGDYLKMCDSIKKIHDYIKYETDSESDEEEEFRIRRVDIPIPFSPMPRLPPFGDNLDDLTIYDTVPPPYQDAGIMYTPTYRRYKHHHLSRNLYAITNSKMNLWR